MLFTKEEELLIVASIRWTERQTSGEVRVFVEDFCMRDHPVERAAEVFHQHGMFNTKYRNAVLIYVAEGSKHLAIWGDSGIHQRVGFQFWTEEKRILREHLADGKACEGICIVIKQIGQQLQKHFPELPNDKNELPDEIIYG
jgi:uncharacterized membrane protein